MIFLIITSYNMINDFATFLFIYVKSKKVNIKFQRFLNKEWFIIKELNLLKNISNLLKAK